MEENQDSDPDEHLDPDPEFYRIRRTTLRGMFELINNLRTMTQIQQSLINNQDKMIQAFEEAHERAQGRIQSVIDRLEHRPSQVLDPPTPPAARESRLRSVLSCVYPRREASAATGA